VVEVFIVIAQRLLHSLKREVRVDTLEDGKAKRNELGAAQRSIFVCRD